MLCYNSNVLDMLVYTSVSVEHFTKASCIMQNESFSCNGAGYNAHGQLGLGDTVRRLQFTPVQGLEHARVTCIVSGDNHCSAICKHGEIYVWGRGDCGQLGLGNEFSHSAPQLLPTYHAVHPNRTLRRQA
jgi:alpha-tubulin suppressor-like RCC1 family protein